MAQLAEASAQAQAMMDQLAAERERSALLEVRLLRPPGNSFDGGMRLLGRPGHCSAERSTRKSLLPCAP